MTHSAARRGYTDPRDTIHPLDLGQALFEAWHGAMGRPNLETRWARCGQTAKPVGVGPLVTPTRITRVSAPLPRPTPGPANLLLGLGHDMRPLDGSVAVRPAFGRAGIAAGPSR